METAIIILAAGNASRFGAPKQLASHATQSLLEHTITQAVNTGFGVMVVTGAYDEELRTTINSDDVLITHNPDWEKGMASSMQAGLRAMLDQYPNLQEAIVASADQPLISTSIFKGLLQLKKHEAGTMVACGYSGTIGIPVLFDRSWFRHLFALSGPRGAKQLLLDHRSQVSVLPFEGGALDIDTPEAYREWQQQLQESRPQ